MEISEFLDWVIAKYFEMIKIRLIFSLSIKLFIRLSDSTEDLNDQHSSEKDTMQRSKRNTDISTKDVIVYTIEGCLPPR